MLSKVDTSIAAGRVPEDRISLECVAIVVRSLLSRIVVVA